MPKAKQQGAPADWKISDDDADEAAAEASAPAPAAPAPAAAAPAENKPEEKKADEPAKADKPASPQMEDGWSGGNVGKVTKTPQPEVSHPADEDDDEAGDGLPDHKATAAAAPVANKFELPSPLPTTYADAYAFHLKLNAIVATTEAEYKQKLVAMEIFGKHVHRLQQGLGMENIDSVKYGHAVAPHNAILTRQRLEAEARSNPLLKELLERYDAAIKHIGTLEAKLAVFVQPQQQQQQQP